MTAIQLREWELYFNEEPFGHDLGFYQSGIIASVIANVNRGKGSKPFTPEDFIPFMYLGKKEIKKEQKQTIEEMEVVMMGMVSTGRATIVRSTKNA